MSTLPDSKDGKAAGERKKVTLLTLREKRARGVPITMVTAYDYPSALAVERAMLTKAENRTKILEESDRLKTAILSSVSHDLRTPLARLRLETEMSVADADAREHMAADIDQRSAPGEARRVIDANRGDLPGGAGDAAAIEQLQQRLHTPDGGARRGGVYRESFGAHGQRVRFVVAALVRGVESNGAGFVGTTAPDASGETRARRQFTGEQRRRVVEAVCDGGDDDRDRRPKYEG